MFNFVLGLMIALVISHVICSGYADLTTMYEKYNEEDDKTLNSWKELLKKQQNNSFKK